MDSKMIKIIAVLAVVVLVGGAAVYVISNNGSSEGKKNKEALEKTLQQMYENVDPYPARLMVLGNADCDDDIDNDDVAAIQKLVDNGYTYTKDYMADANYDGIIDAKDVERAKELIDHNNYNGSAYYINVDYYVREYRMGDPVKVANILTQVLEAECILFKNDITKIVATDERCNNAGTMGTFYKEFESVLDYSKLGNIGSHKTPSAEQYLAVAKDYGEGYLSVWMNSERTYNNGYLEKDLAGTNVQLVRLPSWERGATVNGMLTAGFLFDKYDEAVSYAAWYDATLKTITDKIATLTEGDKKKVAAAYVSNGDNAYDLVYGSSGEYQNLLKLGIIDIGGQYYTDHSQTAGYSTTLTKESFAAFYDEYHFEYLIGLWSGPYKTTEAAVVDTYNARHDDIAAYASSCKLVIYGWIYGTGPHELAFIAEMGRLFYGWTDISAEDILNESLDRMGIYGTGEHQWTYSTLKPTLYYNPSP